MSQGSAGAGESGGVGEETLAGEEVVKAARHVGGIPAPQGFHLGDVGCHAPEHLLDGLRGLLVVVAADVAPHEHLPGVPGELHFAQVVGHEGGIELESELPGCFDLHCVSH